MKNGCKTEKRILDMVESYGQSWRDSLVTDWSWLVDTGWSIGLVQ